ncbi:TetR/AcrR family transcriptional regulator [Cellulomonas humilata]|uniref:TetR/AcrR family transcriptional regulator n=1 Tax=Cellulomonas humilata TaxID=144055 RepID=A0A7Y6DZK9_9CELL|nr:helix-turn-helix domain-containing protein [Cellulomonas humilata]NUU19134.1 TetR/AcrR family transcriptional regulator [Cellulomonas humilata]
MTVELETGTRIRTRKAILDAAVRVLAQDPGASLGQIADAADVGRTTLHRYFPDRADLLAAVTQEAGRRLGDAAVRARLEEGPGLDALLRACQTCLTLGDLLTLLFTETISLEACGDEDGFSRALDDAIARGLADGTLDPRLSPAWLQGTLWSSLYLAWSELREGTSPQHDVVGQLLLTVRKALSA